nr:hypothetical protein [Sphingomonas sp.]
MSPGLKTLILLLGFLWSFATFYFGLFRPDLLLKVGRVLGRTEREVSMNEINVSARQGAGIAGLFGMIVCACGVVVVLGKLL